MVRVSALAGLAAGLCAAATVVIGEGPPIVRYEIIGDAIPASLTGAAGDPGRGRAIVVNRQLGLCLLCHSGPFPEERFQGTIGPDLNGIGARLSEGQIRLRIVDPGRLNPAPIMPAYFRSRCLTRVAPAMS